MARVVYSSPISELVGSIGGLTYQRNSSGFVVRAKPNRKVNPSIAQAQIQLRQSALISLWPTLSIAEKNGWNSLANINPHVTPWGSLTQLNGFQQFISNNLNLAVAGLSPISIAPAYFLPPAPPSFTIFFNPFTIILVFDFPIDPVTYFFSVYATPPMRQSSIKQRKSVLYVPPGNWLGALSYDITVPYTALYNIDYDPFVLSADATIMVKCCLIDNSSGFRSTYSSSIEKIQ